MVSSFLVSACIASSACVDVVDPTVDVKPAAPYVTVDTKDEKACIPAPDLRGAWPSPGNI